MKILESLEAGLYIHIPFCNVRCGYCDFYVVTRRASQIPAYLTALEKEIEIYSHKPEINELVFRTIYFGGGTPSLLSAKQVSSLLKFIKSKFNFTENHEITLEANPGTVDLNKLKALRQAGVNRLSLGVQSFRPNELQLLDRDHSVEQSDVTFNDARKAGFKNITLDLIFGLPKQKLQTWRRNLELSVQLDPNHISIYNLTYKKGTPLTTRLQLGQLKMLSDEVQREMLLTTIDFLQQNGYPQYEISNYAKPGFESIHNQKYWNGSPYLGLGVSSHSFISGRRFWNVRNMKSYMNFLANNTLPVAGDEEVKGEKRALEKVYLELRQRKGLNLKSFKIELGFSFFERHPKPLAKFFSVDFRNKRLVSALTSGDETLKSKLLEIEEGFLRLTKEGVLLCDSICAEFT